MYNVFSQEGSIIIMNDDTEKTRILTDHETKNMFKENPLLKPLKENLTKRIVLDNIHGLKDLP